MDATPLLYQTLLPPNTSGANPLGCPCSDKEFYWSQAVAKFEDGRFLFKINNSHTQQMIGGFVASYPGSYNGPVEEITKTQFETYREFGIEEKGIIVANDMIKLVGTNV